MYKINTYLVLVIVLLFTGFNHLNAQDEYDEKIRSSMAKLESKLSQLDNEGKLNLIEKADLKVQNYINKYASDNTKTDYASKFYPAINKTLYTIEPNIDIYTRTQSGRFMSATWTLGLNGIDYPGYYKAISTVSLNGNGKIIYVANILSGRYAFYSDGAQVGESFSGEILSIGKTANGDVFYKVTTDSGSQSIYKNSESVSREYEKILDTEITDNGDLYILYSEGNKYKIDKNSELFLGPYDKILNGSGAYSTDYMDIPNMLLSKKHEVYVMFKKSDNYFYIENSGGIIGGPYGNVQAFNKAYNKSENNYPEISFSDDGSIYVLYKKQDGKFYVDKNGKNIYGGLENIFEYGYYNYEVPQVVLNKGDFYIIYKKNDGKYYYDKNGKNEGGPYYFLRKWDFEFLDNGSLFFSIQNEKLKYNIYQNGKKVGGDFDFRVSSVNSGYVSRTGDTYDIKGESYKYVVKNRLIKLWGPYRYYDLDVDHDAEITGTENGDIFYRTQEGIYKNGVLLYSLWDKIWDSEYTSLDNGLSIKYGSLYYNGKLVISVKTSKLTKINYKGDEYYASTFGIYKNGRLIANFDWTKFKPYISNIFDMNGKITFEVVVSK